MKKIIFIILILILASCSFYLFWTQNNNNIIVKVTERELKGKKAKSILVKEFKKNKINFNHNNKWVKYISSDWTGDYNCDWISDQKVINKALDFIELNKKYHTLYLKKNTLCIIDEPVLIWSNTVLTWDKSAIIKLKDNVSWWEENKPMIGQKNKKEWHSWWNIGDSISNTEIFWFEIDWWKQEEPTWKRYIPLISFYFPSNVSIHDMYLHNSRWDIIRMSSIWIDNKPYKTDSVIYNNLIITSGHEWICFVWLSNFTVNNNKIFNTRTNSGIRLKDTNNFSVHNNIIWNSLMNKKSSGYSWILVENQFSELDWNAEIFENLIYWKNWWIHLWWRHYNVIYKTWTRKNIYIHHNKIYQTKNMFTEGDLYPMAWWIRINWYDNTRIEYNIIDWGSTNAIIYEWDIWGGDWYKTIVKNNILINNNWYGISNIETTRHKFISEKNVIYNNKKWAYNNFKSNKDIYNIPKSWNNYDVIKKWEEDKNNILIF